VEVVASGGGQEEEEEGMRGRRSSSSSSSSAPVLFELSREEVQSTLKTLQHISQLMASQG